MPRTRTGATTRRSGGGTRGATTRRGGTRGGSTRRGGGGAGSAS